MECKKINNNIILSIFLGEIDMKKTILIIVITVLLIIIASVIGIIYVNTLTLENQESNYSTNKLTLTYNGGFKEAEDSVKWSYEIDLDNKKTTKYCSSTGLLSDEKLIKKYGYDKRITRVLSENEYNIIMQILSETDKYQDENSAIKAGYYIHKDNMKFYISEDDSKTDILKGIEEGY